MKSRWGIALVAAGAAACSMAAVARSGPAVVFELNVAGEEQWEGVLTNVANLQKALPGVRVEMVVHGPALPLLLRADNRLAARLEELHRAGVGLRACENTMRRKKVTVEQLLPVAQPVDSGVAQVVRRQTEGWAYLKAGG